MTVHPLSVYCDQLRVELSRQGMESPRGRIERDPMKIVRPLIKIYGARRRWRLSRWRGAGARRLGGGRQSFAQQFPMQEGAIDSGANLVGGGGIAIDVVL